MNIMLLSQTNPNSIFTFVFLADKTYENLYFVLFAQKRFPVLHFVFFLYFIPCGFVKFFLACSLNPHIHQKQIALWEYMIVYGIQDCI